MKQCCVAFSGWEIFGCYFFLISLKTSNSALFIEIYEKSKCPTNSRKRKIDTESKPTKAPELPKNHQNGKYKIHITVKDILYQPAIIGFKDGG